MLTLAFIAALIAAALNATSAVVQRLATNKPEAKKLFSHRFAFDMVTSKLFIAGFGIQVAAFFAQAAALANGPLIVVEPLLTTDLVFLLLLIRWKLGINISLRDWISAAAIILGLAGLFLAMQPKGGSLNYNLNPWIVLVSSAGSIIIILALIIRRLKSPITRALLAALAAAASYALNAAFTKLGLNLFSKYGLEALLTSWPLYALIVSGLISIYLMVNAYGSGPLAISQPIMEIFEPALAVTIGISIFGETYNTSTTALLFGSISTVVLVLGVIYLASSPRVHRAGDQGL